MGEDISLLPRRHGSPVASISSTPRRSPAGGETTPRLGDFSRLHSSSLAYTPEEEKPVSLGNFSKIFTNLTPSLSGTPPKTSSPQPSRLSPSIEYGPLRLSTSATDIPESLVSIRDALRRKLFISLTPSTTDSESEENAKGDTDGYCSITPETTPPSSMERESSPIVNLVQAQQPVLGILKRSKAASPRQPLPQPLLQTILSYQLIKHGPLATIHDKPRSVTQQHESLCRLLIPHLALDTVLATQCPHVAVNGIHVFLDMSNINISFQQALRNRYKLAENARFVPLPQLNLAFLTEILVRCRPVNILNAGCSVQPGHSEPRFVRELRDLDYHVDLRERKRTEEPTRTPQTGSNAQHSSSDEASLRRQVRYVEDLVDETLQTRIAESVMEHFATPGTLIIATGDAKPAKYSDGFFTYADRALRMGWHVEVVSWRASMSCSWRDPEWMAQWGDRFRVIELDAFLDDLLYVQA
ncbi:hypothetical protein NLU13_8329 [Sarocladium strictum]|uniref:Cell wall glucanase n=1 Tax=Sarocladium strictum TaxID=5046 RepID=A0AA39L4J1_SARSR|nr:hypothetical protein NLU13_8329 [Sarocladium strictum]